MCFVLLERRPHGGEGGNDGGTPPPFSERAVLSKCGLAVCSTSTLKYLYTASLRVYSQAATWKAQTKVLTRRLVLAHGRPELFFRDVTDLFPPSFTSTTAHSRPIPLKHPLLEHTQTRQPKNTPLVVRGTLLKLNKNRIVKLFHGHDVTCRCGKALPERANENPVGHWHVT